MGNGGRLMALDVDARRLAAIGPRLTRSGAAADDAIVQGKWEPVSGKTTLIDASLLSKEVRQLWPIYLDLAFGPR